MTLIAGIALRPLPLSIVISEDMPPLLFLMAPVSVTPHVSWLRNFAVVHTFPFLVPAGSNIIS